MVSISASGQESGSLDQTAISADSIPIVYEVHGNGNTSLVFIHGWSCDKNYWKGQVDPFSRQNKVVVIDLAGHGKSGFGRKNWTMQAFGEDVAAVVNKLGLQRIILIGHSMGGDVIAEAALRLPGRVLGMVMVDTYKKLGTARSPEQVEAFVSRFRSHFPDSTKVFVRSMFLPGSDSALVEMVAGDMSMAPPDVALGALASALSYSQVMPQTLLELKLPVIAINPDNSPTNTASMKRYGVEVMIMPSVGHFLMMEDAEGFNRILLMAIEKLSKRL